MNEKIIKAINDLNSAKDSFKELTSDEQRFVVQTVFGVDAIEKITMILNEIYSKRRF